MGIVVSRDDGGKGDDSHDNDDGSDHDDHYDTGADLLCVR